MDESEAMDFFNQLSTNVENSVKDNHTVHLAANSDNFYSDNLEPEVTQVTTNNNWDLGAEDLIKRNLLIGNFRGALDCAIQNQRYAHAFLIAYAKKDDPELMQLAADNFSLLIQDPVSKMLQKIINNDIEDMIQSYDLNRWKELTAFIISNYPQTKSSLLSMLGTRLVQNGKREAAQAIALLNRDYELFFHFIKE